MEKDKNTGVVSSGEQSLSKVAPRQQEYFFVHLRLGRDPQSQFAKACRGSARALTAGKHRKEAIRRRVAIDEQLHRPPQMPTSVETLSTSHQRLVGAAAEASSCARAKHRQRKGAPATSSPENHHYRPPSLLQAAKEVFAKRFVPGDARYATSRSESHMLHQNGPCI